jgi:hypothetical protein
LQLQLQFDQQSFLFYLPNIRILSCQPYFFLCIQTAKDRLGSNEFNSSNVALCNACTPLSRLLQIAKLMNLDDVEDVLDLISSSKRKGNWDLSMEDSKAYLSLRVEFEADLVSQLLKVVDEE